MIIVACQAEKNAIPNHAERINAMGGAEMITMQSCADMIIIASQAKKFLVCRGKMIGVPSCAEMSTIPGRAVMITDENSQGKMIIPGDSKMNSVLKKVETSVVTMQAEIPCSTHMGMQRSKLGLTEAWQAIWSLLNN